MVVERLGAGGVGVITGGKEALGSPSIVGRLPIHPCPHTLTGQQIMMRAIAFFYHLSLSITFTVWTELLLDDFGGDFSKASDFLGCVRQ